jgi:hypothetical protein
MEPFTLFDEIYGWNRSEDEVPALVTPQKSGATTTLMPWEDELFDFRPCTDQASKLCTQLESADLIAKVLGIDEGEALQAVAPSAAATTSLDNVLSKVSGRIAMKIKSNIVNAPLRKKRISEIIDMFKSNLVSKGYEPDTQHLENLQASTEKFLMEAVASV